MERTDQKKKGTIALGWLQGLIIKRIEEEYFKKGGEVSFPATDEDKIERVLYEQKENREDHRQNIKHLEQRVGQVQQLVGQVLHATFTSQSGEQGVLSGGSKMWEHRKGMQIEGPLLTCKDVDENKEYGARYLTPFTAEFPDFEVVILETGKQRWLGVGVVHKDYYTGDMPGLRSGTVGYHTDNGKIFHGSNDRKETKGPIMASRGDRIRCTIMFKNETLNDGKKQVPVSLFLNGSKIITKEGEDQFFMDSDRPLYPYIGMTNGCSVLAKMCPRKVEDKIAALDSKVTETNWKLNTLLARMTDMKEEHEMWKVHPGIRIEGLQLTCECRECAKPDVCCLHGARYRNNLSPEFPHFEVAVLETGEKRGLGIGVVNENYYMNVMPGWDIGSVGYHIDDGIIYPNANQKGTRGKIRYTCFAKTVSAHQGDRIRCTIMFENEIVIDGKGQVPIMFFLNGRKIITEEGEDQFFIDFNKPLFPYICMTDGGSALAKMCPREVYKIVDVDSKVTKSLGKTKWRLDKMWEHRMGMRIEGNVLTCIDVQKYRTHGARCLKPFSAEFPHFEVVILETEEQGLGIGVVYDDYDTSEFPGSDEGTVGYNVSAGSIYPHVKIIKGPVTASRGDRIRCTVMFENEKVIDGKKKLPITFFLNGSQIVTKDGEDQFFMDSERPLFPCISMYNGFSAWAKMLRKDEPEANLPRWLKEFLEEIKQEENKT